MHFFRIFVTKHGDRIEKSSSFIQNHFSSCLYQSFLYFGFQNTILKRFFQWQSWIWWQIWKNNPFHNLFQYDFWIFNGRSSGFCCFHWWSVYKKDGGEIQWKWMVEASELKARTNVAWFHSNQQQDIYHWWIYWWTIVSEKRFKKIY